LSLKKVSYRSVSGGGGGGFLAPPRTKEATATAAKDVDGDMLLADREDFVRDLRSEAIQRDGECDIIIALASFCETPQSSGGLTDGLSASKIHGKELWWRPPARPHERSHPRDGHHFAALLLFPSI
jgi:hypothetical protein